MIKAWGATDRQLLTDKMQIELIHVQPGGFCSVHHHMFKDNLFMVLSGCLTVSWGWREIDFNDEQAPPMIEQLTGVSAPLMIPAGVLHQFQNNSNGEAVALEVYRSKPGFDLEPDDIQRHFAGGRNVGNNNHRGS